MSRVQYTVNGKSYVAREVESPKFGLITVGSYLLMDAVAPDFGRVQTTEQREVDEKIFFYIPNTICLGGNDDDVIQEVEKSVC